MEAVANVLFAVALLALAGVALWAAIRRRSARVPHAPGVLDQTHVDVTLDIPKATSGEAGQRLANEAGRRILATSRHVEEVRVLARDGGVLGTFVRHPGEAGPAPDPRILSTPPPGVSSRRREPDAADEALSRALERPHDGAPDDTGPAPLPRPKPLASRLDLPPEVRSRLSDPENAQELVRALLEAGGHRIAVDGPVIHTDTGEAVIVIPAPWRRIVTREELNAAWFAFKASGDRHGVVITPGTLDHGDIHVRELAAPALRHAGADDMQRMADALALGGDPLHFAVAARAPEASAG